MKNKIPNFTELVDKMEGYYNNLKDIEREHISKVLKGLKGVYIFYENEIPVYVGKTDNLARRLNQHISLSSKDNDANFAFKIARLEWLEKNEIEKKITRKFLQNISEFGDIFKNAKSRVSSMKMKYVNIENPYEQYLFEFYAALKTQSIFNEFNNH